MPKPRALNEQPLTNAERRRVVRFLLDPAHDEATLLKLWSVMGARGRTAAGARFGLDLEVDAGTLSRRTATDGVTWYRLTPEACHHYADRPDAPPMGARSLFDAHVTPALSSAK